MTRPIAWMLLLAIASLFLSSTAEAGLRRRDRSREVKVTKTVTVCRGANCR